MRNVYASWASRRGRRGTAPGTPRSAKFGFRTVIADGEAGRCGIAFAQEQPSEDCDPCARQSGTVWCGWQGPARQAGERADAIFRRPAKFPGRIGLAQPSRYRPEASPSDFTRCSAKLVPERSVARPSFRPNEVLAEFSLCSAEARAGDWRHSARLSLCAGQGPHIQT